MIDPAAQVDVAGNIAFGASNGTCSTPRSLLHRRPALCERQLPSRELVRHRLRARNAPGPAHRTILNGTGPQTITFAHPTQSGLANLDVTSAANVTLNSNARVTADLLLVGRVVVPATHTLTITGALTAQAGAVLDNQGTTTAGSCQLDPAATFNGQPPSCP